MTSSAQSAPPRERFWTPARLVRIFAALVVIAAIGSSSCSTANDSKETKVEVTSSKSTSAANAQTPSLVPLPASVRDAEMETVDGKVFKLADYKGKILVLNLWATWCGPCKTETPHLVELSKEYKDRGVEIIGVATRDNDPDLDAVKEFMRQQKVTYPMAYVDGSIVAPLIQRNVIPQSFIISRDGNSILLHITGFNPAATPAKLREAIEQSVNLKS